MKRESRSQSWAGLMASVFVMALLTAAASGQPPTKVAAKPTANPAVKEAVKKVVKTRKKPRGRLPAYFSRVVTAKQREQIYSIQARYNEQIEKLQQQLKTLVTQRDGDVEKVLSDQQRAEVDQLRAQRKAKRAAAKAAKVSAADATRKG